MTQRRGITFTLPVPIGLWVIAATLLVWSGVLLHASRVTIKRYVEFDLRYLAIARGVIQGASDPAWQSEVAIVLHTLGQRYDEMDDVVRTDFDKTLWMLIHDARRRTPDGDTRGLHEGDRGAERREQDNRLQERDGT